MSPTPMTRAASTSASQQHADERRLVETYLLAKNTAEVKLQATCH